MEIINKKTLTSCAPPRCQCAEMELDYQDCTVEVRDDFGGIIKMSFEEMAILARKFLLEV